MAHMEERNKENVIIFPPVGDLVAPAKPPRKREVHKVNPENEED